MKDQIKVFAPATVSNVGCGYDIMGFALDQLGEELVVRRTAQAGLVIKRIVGFDNIPYEAHKNSATIAVQAMLDSIAGVDGGFEFEIYKNIYPGSGLGTSASSSAGAVYAVNELLGRPLSPLQLVEFAMEGEKSISGKAHADNVAPTIMGGFVIIRSYQPLDIIDVPFPENLYVSIVHPQVEIKTSEARQLLGDSVSLANAVIQWGNVAGLVAGLYSGNMELIGNSMQDVVAEPYRAGLIPEYSKVKKIACESGAIGCNISGSGPSVFAFSTQKEQAKEIAHKMKEIYDLAKIKANAYTSQVGSQGVRTIR